MLARCFIALFLLAVGSPFARDVNGCLELDGKSGRSELRGIEGLQTLNGDSTYTIQSWIKPRTQGGAGRGRLLDQVGSSLTWYLSDEGRFGFRPNRTIGWQLSDGGAISYWEWQHVAVTSDGQVLRFFVNGKLLNAIPGNTVLAITKRPVLIGNGEGEDQTARGFDGWIDDFRIDSECKWRSDFTPPLRGQGMPLDSTVALWVTFDQIGGGTIVLDQSTYNCELLLGEGCALSK